MKNLDRKKRIVLTGGPGGGKTTALDLFQRELSGRLVAVPEAATMIWNGGIERTDNAEATKATQTAIFHLQHHLEEVQRRHYPNRLILCDRGSLDGLAYWPNSEAHFFEAMGSSYEEELARYDAVIFFETAAKSNQGITSNNPMRTESELEAIELDDRLQRVWSRHPNFNLVGSAESFLQKIVLGIRTIESVIESM